MLAALYVGYVIVLAKLKPRARAAAARGGAPGRRCPRQPTALAARGRNSIAGARQVAVSAARPPGCRKRTVAGQFLRRAAAGARARCLIALTLARATSARGRRRHLGARALGLATRREPNADAAGGLPSRPTEPAGSPSRPPRHAAWPSRPPRRRPRRRRKRRAAEGRDPPRPRRRPAGRGRERVGVPTWFWIFGGDRSLAIARDRLVTSSRGSASRSSRCCSRRSSRSRC